MDCIFCVSLFFGGFVDYLGRLWISLDILHLFAHLLDIDLQVDRGLGAAAIDRLGATAWLNSWLACAVNCA